ncbi:MAG: TauD/TfdA family dioxygenase [Pseudomonadota bacterium]
MHAAQSVGTLSVEPLSGVGALVHGIDLREPLTKAQGAAIRAAVGEHCVLFFRDQALSPDEHIQFADAVGVINVNRFFATLDGYPTIAEVRKEPHQRSNQGGGWHTDQSYDTKPAMGSILYARQVPASGGDTLFADMYKAYETLSPGLQTALKGLRAVHSSRHIFGPNAKRFADPNNDLKDRLKNADLAVQDAIHPVVIRHPISGRSALYVNRAFTLHFDGWTVEESKPLLDFLYAHAVRPEHTTRFAWQPGSIAFWDNRAAWHYALNDYQGQRRVMHRITIEGETLSAA